MSNWLTLIVGLLTLLGLETIGMDGMLIVLSWLVMALLFFGFIGESLHQKRMDDLYRRHPHLLKRKLERAARLRAGGWH